MRLFGRLQNQQCKKYVSVYQDFFENIMFVFNFETEKEKLSSYILIRFKPFGGTNELGTSTQWRIGFI